MEKLTNAPFDAVAVQYDTDFTETQTGKSQRDIVYRHLLAQNWPPGRLLELNCGTGADALWWASQGWEVVASDISQGMVDQARQKINTTLLSPQITVFQADARDIHRKLLELPEANCQFDLIFSNFGGLNCISPENFRQLATQLTQLLSPGGRLVMVIMGRFCWWETLYFLLKGRLKSAFRRWSVGPVAAPLAAEITVDTWYYSPAQIARFFPALGVEKINPVGFFVPPSYLDPLQRRIPGFLKLMQKLDKVFQNRYLSYASDHFLVVLK